MAEASQTRYTAVAVTLHWLIAIAIISLIFVGWWMSDAINDPAQRQQAYLAYQLHKSAGLTVLALTVLRIVWRLTHKPPPLPAGMKAWEKFAAGAVHVAFYAIMLLAPLSGWAYVSAGWSLENDAPFSVPTFWFGLFEVPPLPGLADAPNEMKRRVAENTMSTHSALAWATFGLLALHVAAALKHHIFNKDNVLVRMAPFLKPRASA